MSSRDPAYFIGKPVESMQHMLRVLSLGDSRLLPVVADGIFGQNTRAAVMAYQRVKQRPATGMMDLLTWELLVADYEKEIILQREAEPIVPILNPRQVIRPGDTNYHVLLVQAILKTLCCAYGCTWQISLTGTMDAPTVAALRRFQTMSGLQATGILDKITWRHLAKQYTLAAGDGTGASPCIREGDKGI